MCEKCEELEDRLDKLESWVWNHVKYPNCLHSNGSNLCGYHGFDEDEQVVYCGEQVCPEFPEEGI